MLWLRVCIHDATLWYKLWSDDEDDAMLNCVWSPLWVLMWWRGFFYLSMMQVMLLWLWWDERGFSRRCVHKRCLDTRPGITRRLKVCQGRWGKRGECRALPLRTVGIGGESHYGGHLNKRCLAQACRCADDPGIGKRRSFQGSGPLRMRDGHRRLAASVPYHDDVG